MAKRLYAIKCIAFLDHPGHCKYNASGCYEGLLMCCHSCERYGYCLDRCKNMVHKCGKTAIEEVYEKKHAAVREEKEARRTMPTEKKRYRIIQYDRNGVKLAVYYSYKDASEAIGVSDSFISRAARGVAKSAGGYLWERELIEDE